MAMIRIRPALHAPTVAEREAVARAADARAAKAAKAERERVAEREARAAGARHKGELARLAGAYEVARGMDRATPFTHPEKPARMRAAQMAERELSHTIQYGGGRRIVVAHVEYIANHADEIERRSGITYGYKATTGGGRKRKELTT